MEFQVLPSVLGFITSTFLFLGVKLYIYREKQKVRSFYELYAASIMTLVMMEKLDERTSIKYVENLIPLYELKFKFKYKIKDFFKNKELYEESAEKIRELYES